MRPYSLAFRTVDFKAVKAAITMEQVLGHYGLMDKFKRGTDSLNGPCPIHKGSNRMNASPNASWG
jgi:hypothetical protein